MNKKALILSALLSIPIYAQKPFVFIDLQTFLGNQLWNFSVAKIIAQELGNDLYCRSIYGFPNTYQYHTNYPRHNRYPSESYDLHANIKKIISNKNPRNILLNGFYQHYSYIEQYANVIKNDWLKMDPAMLSQVDKDDLVVHVRIEKYDAPNMDKTPLPFEYYEKAIAMVDYKQLYICTNEPEHPFIKQFARYSPIIKSTRSFSAAFLKIPGAVHSKMNTDDFMFIASFNKIIISYSTYSWWAAFLSNATEIYAPFNAIGEGYTHYGKVNESRYTYIPIAMY